MIVDLLHDLAAEHRDIEAVTRCLQAGDDGAATVGSVAARVVEHELLHRLLLHPLLARDRWGRALLRDRRQEQVLLADQLCRVLHAREPVPRALAALERQLTDHTDREEILDFPHVRHETPRPELDALAAVAGDLRAEVRRRLEADDRIARDGTWATAHRRDLPDLLGLPQELASALPERRARRATSGAR